MISVLILTANRREALEKCLQSIEKQSYKDFEIIVIDNGSTDGTQDFLKSIKRTNFHYFRNETQGSFAEARNISIKMSKGEILAFIDDDCEAEPDWLERIKSDFEKADAVGGLVLPGKELKFPWWWVKEIGWVVGLSVPGMKGELGGIIYYPQTANLAVRRNVFEKSIFQEVGGDFKKDRDVYLGGREDAELWKRLRVEGYRTLIDPDLIVWHNIPQNRLRLRFIIKKAIIDGKTFFYREKKFSYTQQAISDIINFPFEIFKASVKKLSGYKKIKLKSIFFDRLLWTFRQIGFITALIKSNKCNFFNLCNITVTELITHTKNLFWFFIDLFISIWVACVKRSKIPEHPQKILILASTDEFKLLRLTHLLHTLKISLPQSSIILSVPEKVGEFFSENNLADEVFQTPDNFKLWKTLIEEQRPQLIIIPYADGFPAEWLLFKARIPVITFLSGTGFKHEVLSHFAEALVEKSSRLNESFNLLSLLEPLEISTTFKEFIPAIPAKYQSWIEKIISEHSLDKWKLIGLEIAGNAHLEEKWGDEKWLELANLIEQEGVDLVRIIFFGEKSKIEEIKKKSNKNLKKMIFIEINSIWEKIALISKLDIFVGVNGVGEQIAYLIGKKSIVLYGRESEVIWGHWRGSDPNYIILRRIPNNLTKEELLDLPLNYHLLKITTQDVFLEIKI